MHLNAEFQRKARRDKKAFLSDQCKEIEENNRMGRTRDLFKIIRDIWESMFFLHTQSRPHYHQFLGILSKYKYVRSHIATETQHNIVISDKFQL